MYNKDQKLTRSHIDLTAFSCMNVALAAQVFSFTIALALDDAYGNTVSETTKFIRHMDTFFDCLNVRHYNDGEKQRKTDVLAFFM